MEKVVFNKKETHFTVKLDSNLRKKIMKCNTLNTAFVVLKMGHFGT